MFRFFVVWAIYYYTSDMIPIGLWQFWYWYVFAVFSAPTVLLGWVYATTLEGDEERWEKFGWWFGWYALFSFLMIRYLDFSPPQFLAPPTDLGALFGFIGLVGVLGGLLINFIGWVRYTLSYDNAWH